MHRNLFRRVCQLGLFSLALSLSSCVWFEPSLIEPNACKESSVMALARELDQFERHLERHGSIVIQQPSVWGQARLTQYREEFETEIVKDLDKFQETLQGRLARQDQAVFASVSALQAAITGPVAVRTPPPPGVKGDIIPVPDAALPSPDVAPFDKLRAPAAPGFKSDKGAISLEPTLVLEQKARYLNYLNQIRRTNEGDDTADSPGYSLNLMRIPVSVLPGRDTDQGYGAEVTLTLEPMCSPELLPTTFRNLVLNDLAQLISTPLVTFLNDPDQVSQFLNEKTRFVVNYLAERPHALDRDIEESWRRWDEARRQTRDWNAAKGDNPPARLRVEYVGMTEPAKTEPAKSDPAKTEPPVIVGAVPMPSRQIYVSMCDSFRCLSTMSRSLPSLSYSKSRNGRQPFSPSQVFDVYGYDFPFHIAYEANVSLRKRIGPGQLIHLPELQAYIREEVAGAYKFLSSERNAELWSFCTHELATAILARRTDEIAKTREEFRAAVKKLTQSRSEAACVVPGHGDAAQPLSTALAWAILVDCALLNEHLIEDMRQTAVTKQHPLNTEWQPYFLPNPPPEAREAFAAYVRARWPICVFALDPVTQDQNIADSYTRRQEMQLALSSAFMSGAISARNFTRWARRLDSEFDTLAVHRTAVGFSHGENTFGWRFYPRMQSPEFESHWKAFFRDQLIGGPHKSHLLHQQRLEPGIRDCVALVLMPAFVPNLQCQVTSSYFSLNNPQHRKLDSVTAMRLSRSIHAIQASGAGVDAECYRAEDVAGLFAKARQLAERLPMQSHRIPVPYENTVGGFEMFSNGVTDLAPELVGWYGGPGVMLSQPTTLFLIGDHFSVKNTRVNAGGVSIEPAHQRMLSRQIVQVTIPKNVELTEDAKGRRFVAVHVATPYGVTQPLLLPVVTDVPLAPTFPPPPTPVTPEKK
jgi:hypothetical protein